MRYTLRAALLAATSLVVALPALAQEEENVVVTATRAPTPVNRLPADVTIIDVDEVLSRGQTTLAQAVEDTPGLGVVASGGPGQQTSLFAGGANSYHTLVLFDGLRLNDPSTPNSSFDAGQDQIFGMSRIEVVEGPMSAVFGSDAIGGVVNMIPRHGGEGPLNARLDMAGGSFGTLTAAAGIDGSVGAFRYAVTAEGYANNGFDIVPERMSVHTDDDDPTQMMAITGVFDLALTENLSLDLLARHREARADFDAFGFEFLPPFREFRFDDTDLEIAKNDVTLARLGATWTVSDALSLRATAGGMRQEREQRDGGQLTDSFQGERRFGDLTLNWQPGAAGALEDIAVVAGVAAEREQVDIAQGFGFPPPFAFTVAEQDERSAFVTAQGRTGALSLTGAARLDDYEGFGANTTFRLGASFDVTPFARIYGAYGTSFRAPTVYERFTSFGNADLDPEQGESWEFGGDARFAAFGQDTGIELAALYRHTDIHDLINFGALIYENIDKAEIETAELRLGVRPLSWLTLRASYTFIDARDASDDSELLRRPRDAWTASAEVKQGGFTGRLSWRSVGERQDTTYGDDGFALGIASTPAYDIARASLAYAFAPGAEAYVAVENAFDETYEPTNGFAGAPRSVLVGLRLRSAD